MKDKNYDMFRLEDRVLFEAAAAVEIVEAAEAAQDNPNANVSETDRQAQDSKDALKNAPPDKPAEQAIQEQGKSQADPSEAADVDAQVEQLIQGEIPMTDGDAEMTIPEISDLSSAVEEAEESGNLVDAVIVPSDTTISSGKELVVINGTIPDREAVLAELKPNQEALILEDGSGLAELNEYLNAHEGKYDAIHLITHGNEGYLSINGELIDAENLDAAEWADVGEHLTDDGDILLYGCNTAATEKGRLLVDRLAEASGADVAASTNTTGISGDWKLEYHDGTIDNMEIAVENFEHNLTNYTVTNLDDSGNGSLRWAIEQANNNTGTDEITFSVNGTIMLESEISITDSLTIIGNGIENTILDGQNKTRHLNLNAMGISIEIQGITFQNGYADNGGAIYSDQEGFYFYLEPVVLVIRNAKFVQNHAENDGGAIYLRFDGGSNTSQIFGSLLLEENIPDALIFTNNTAGGVGGAIALEKSYQMTINGGTFKNNSATDSGGVVFWSVDSGLSNGGLLTINNGTFAENSAGWGGVISGGTLTINNGVFSKNSATMGGVIKADNLIINNGIFTENSAIRSGGVIHSFAGSTMINGGTFEKNSAILSGGVIYTEGPLEITGGTYYGNIATGNDDLEGEGGGGVIYHLGGGYSVLLNENSPGTLIFRENKAVNQEGGVIWTGSPLKIIGGTFAGNSAINGGAIYCVDDGDRGDKLIVTGTTFSENSAVFASGGGSGGAISSGMPAEITDATFYKNSAYFSGGALSAGEIVITGGVFSENSVTDGSGGAISSFNVAVSNTTFKNNSARDYGGGILGSGIINNCIFQNNTANYGGGISNYTSPLIYSRSVISNCIFQNNVAKVRYAGGVGGALYLNEADTVINNCTFRNNSADKGGAIGMAPYDKNVTIMNSTFVDNSVTDIRNGGTIHLDTLSNDTVTVDIINSIILGNQENISDIVLLTTSASNSSAIRLYHSIAGNLSSNVTLGSGSQTGASYQDVFQLDDDGNLLSNDDSTVPIKNGGLAAGTGVYVWLSDDYSTIAYSKSPNGMDKILVRGTDINLAINKIDVDQHGEKREYVTDRGALIRDGLFCVNITVNNDTYTYNGKPQASSGYTWTAPAPEFTIDDSGAVYTYTNAEGVVSTETPVNEGEYSVTISGLKLLYEGKEISADKYIFNYIPGTVTITAKEITIDPNDPNFRYTIDSKVYDGNRTVSGAELSVLIDGETVLLNWTDGQFNSKNVLSVSNATFTGLTSANSNYVLATDTVTVGAVDKITAKDITVTANAVTQVYGDMEQALTYKVNGLVADDTLSGTLERAAGKTVGEYEITQGTLANSNYIIHFTGGKYTITKRDLTITAGDILEHSYGTAYTLVYTSSTLGIGDSFTGNLVIDPKDAHKSQSGNYAVGDHVITIGNLDIVDESGVDMSDNYNIHFNEGTLNIVQTVIEVAAVEVADKVYDGTTSATLESWSFNNPVANADALQLSGTASFATKHAGVGKLASVKDFVLTGADAGNYILRSDVELSTTATIDKASLHIVLDDAAKKYGSADPEFTVKNSVGLQIGDQITGIDRSDKGENVGKYAIDQYVIDDGNGGGNYNVESFTAGTLTISSKVLTIAIDNVEFTYNGTEQFATSYTTNGLETGDVITSLTVEGVKDAGIYSIAATDVKIRNNGQDVTGNYTISFIRNTDNVTVKAADVTVNASDSVVTYGEDYSLVHDGVLFGNDAFTGELAVIDGSTSSSGKLNAGTYTIDQGTLDAGKNYNLIFHTGVMTVNKAELSVKSMSAADRSYDGSDVATMTGYTFDGLLIGDQVTLTGTGRFADRHAGTDKAVTFEDLVISGVDSGNYRLTTDDFMTTADISRALIEIRANDAGKGYGSSDPALSYTVLSGKLYGTDTIAINREAGENVGTYAIDRYEVNDGNGGGNYEVIFTPGNFTIGAKSAVISVGTTIVGYNGEVQHATEYTIDGLESGHSVYQINLSGARNAGTHTVTVESIQIHDADGNDVTANYGLSYHAGTLEIHQAEITVNAMAETIIYGEQANAGYTYHGTLYGSDGFTGTLSIAGAMNSQNTLYAAGTARFERGTLEIADGNNGDNYHITFVGANLTVEAKEISLSAVEIQDKVYDGTTDAAVLTAMVSGMEAGDSLSVVTDSASASFVSKNVGADIEVNADGFVLAGADRNNYILKSDSFKTTADITKANLTIYTQNISKIYGDNDPEFTFSADGLKMGDSITDLGRSNTGTNVGSYDIDLYILNDGNNGNNYNVTLHSGKLTIIPKNITVTADTQTKVYGEADPELTYQVNGLVGDDMLAGSLEREAGEDVGEYAITQGTLANSNYKINFTGANLTITAKEITIDPNDPNFHYTIDSKVYDGNRTVRGAELSVVIGGETVNLNWTDGQFNSKNVVSVIDATFSGLTSANSNYVLSADRVTVDAAGKILAKDITVTADAQTKVYGCADPELTYQVSGLVGNDTLAGSLTRAVGEDVGSYEITQGTLANSNYNINFTGANLTIIAKEITIDPNDPNFHYAIDSKVYDGNRTVNGAKLSVLIDGETVVLNWTDGQFNSKDVVSVTDATFTGLTSSNGNYVLSTDSVTVDATGKILAKDITVTADAQTKVYGSADPELTYQVSGLVGNDTLAGSLTRAVGEDVGSYEITLGTLANSNYKINFTGANFTITTKSDVVVKPSGLNFDQYSEAVNPNFSALHPALTGRGLASVGLFSRLNENVYAMNHSALHAHLELRNGLRGSINNETASGRAVLPIDHSMMTIDAPLKNHSGFLFSRTMVMKPEALANGKEIMIDSSFAELRPMENTSAEKTHSSWHFLPESVKLPRSFFIDDVPAEELPDPAYDLRGIRAELPRRADAFKSELDLLLEELVGA